MNSFSSLPSTFETQDDDILIKSGLPCFNKVTDEVLKSTLSNAILQLYCLSILINSSAFLTP